MTSATVSRIKCIDAHTCMLATVPGREQALGTRLPASLAATIALFSWDFLLYQSGADFFVKYPAQLLAGTGHEIANTVMGGRGVPLGVFPCSFGGP